MQSTFSVERDLSICLSFSLLPSTYGKFLLILIFSSWISMACIWCCNWDKFWLLIILLRILVILLCSWYPYYFNTSIFFGYVIFICDSGICSNKQEGNSTFCATCLVVRAVVKVLVSIAGLPVYKYRDKVSSKASRNKSQESLNKVLRNASSPVLPSSIANLIFWWRLLMLPVTCSYLFITW